jgi:hypothetical protein
MMADPNRDVSNDGELVGVLSLTASFMLMNFQMAVEANPEDAPELEPASIEVVVIGRIQEFILNIQEQERRPHLLGMDLPILMSKVNEQCQRWLEGDFR